MTTTLTFATFGPEHLDGAVALSRQCKSPHRREDWDLALGLSSGVVALDADRVVGTALATPFGPVAAANMIIVDESMRGLGLGLQLMNRMMARANPLEWRLISTDSGRPLYEKLGYVATGRIAQLQGPVAAVAAPAGIDWAGRRDRDTVAALDRAATGGDRGALIDALFRLGQVAVIREAAGIVGYAVLRAFGRGEVAGPVVARDTEAAQRLLAFLFAGRTGEFLRVDAGEETGLAPWLASVGLARTGGGLCMRRGLAPRAPSPFRTFALANQALG